MIGWNTGVWNDGVWNDDAVLVSPPSLPPAVPGDIVGAVWAIYVVDAAGVRVALIDDYQLAATARFNDVGSWVLAVVPGSLGEALLREPGAGIVAVRDGVVFISGPVTSTRRTRSGVTPAAEIAGVSDEIALADRIAYPEAPALTTGTSSHYTVDGVAETVMRQLVSDNLGPTADVSRSTVLLAPDLVRGTAVKDSFRLQTVLEALQRLAISGGVGFRVNHTFDDTAPGLPVFEVYDIADRSADVVLSDERGSLGDYVYGVAAGAANVVLVAGGGEGVARLFRTRTDATSIAAWRRIEFFRDARDTIDPDILDRRGDETLATSAEKVVVEVVPIATAGTAFGVDYTLGDKVSAIVGGVLVTEVVRAVEVTVTADGETLTPIMSSIGRPTKVPFLAYQRDLSARLSLIENR